MDATNPVVRLCVEGMQAEGDGKPEEAQDLYARACAASWEDFDACVAAHYLARQQPSAEETLRWNKEALDRPDAVGDERVWGFYPALYLNVGKSQRSWRSGRGEEILRTCRREGRGSPRRRVRRPGTTWGRQ